MKPSKASAEVDMKLEVVDIPVSDVDRAKEFYRSLGWRLEQTPPGVVQCTPPGSTYSVQFGTTLTSASNSWRGEPETVAARDSEDSIKKESIFPNDLGTPLGTSKKAITSQQPSEATPDRQDVVFFDLLSHNTKDVASNPTPATMAHSVYCGHPHPMISVPLAEIAQNLLSADGAFGKQADDQTIPLFRVLV